jgi:glycosyltransferase involved in cell wall biosynthesis
MLPLISVGMPVYNGERFIVETLESLLLQSFKDFEVVVCDNASSDNTESICRSYEKRDERIRYYRNPRNLGAAKNYKKTFELSRGKYFRWANCDDLFEPASLERCLRVLEGESSVVLTYPKTKIIDQNGKFVAMYDDNSHLVSESPSQRFRKLSTGGLKYINIIYGLMRSETLRKTKLMRGFAGGDLPLVQELSLYGKFWEIPEVLFLRRFHGGSFTALSDLKAIQEFFDPKTMGRREFGNWRHLIANCDSVQRAPIRIREKVQIYEFLLRSMIWSRHELAGELLSLVKREK